MMHQLVGRAARRRRPGGSGGAAAPQGKLIIHGWVAAARAPLDISREKKKKERKEKKPLALAHPHPPCVQEFHTPFGVPLSLTSIPRGADRERGHIYIEIAILLFLVKNRDLVDDAIEISTEKHEKRLFRNRKGRRLVIFTFF